ncbi:hypothetical protein HDF16_004915 [Granulicella aggregans]|uniref:Sel1 repeat family protein n=1 Tax=Granulicella aggregans TaxID=474949 RepID=A0A7W7ZIK1_9BACT|nr:hypothetical protein [Granulicella aggregans]MBB5060179.1 hypothetical protein [Granulicella aggregans]
MTVAEFEASDGRFDQPAVHALWLAGRGEWEHAHEIAQSEESREGAWVHAYLHRAEGDTSNASYWYRRAGRPAGTGDLRAEWEAIVTELLNQDS